MVDETQLLLKLQSRQKNSIDQAIDIYTPYLSTVLYNLAGSSLSKEDAEEIISDVFLTLWKNAECIDLSKGTLRSYIAAVARNFALKRLRNKREILCLDDVEITADEAPPTDSAEKELLWEAVMSLGEPDNEIFVRFYLFDESLKDISKAMGLNISTVKTRLSRGKRKLKNLLGAEEML